MTDKKNQQLNVIETDVFVIGGGFAGCFAAVKAAEAGRQGDHGG